MTTESCLVFGMRCVTCDAGKSKSKKEYIPDRKNERWNKFNSIPDNRKILSNLYEQPMKIDNLTFKTVEHYLQYRKIRLTNQKIAEDTFTMESKSKIALGTGFDAQKARKIVKLTEDQLEYWHKIEQDKAKEMAKIHKFSPGTNAYNLLMSTNDAQLWSYAPRHPLVRMKRTEELRDRLKNIYI